MRPREAIGNWLICAVLSSEREQPLCFTSDPLGGDGIIYDEVAARPYPTEHVYVPPLRPGQTGDIHELILKAVRAKETRGAPYAAGKMLVVFLDVGLGEWSPTVAARRLPPGHFVNVWVVDLQPFNDQGEYTYAVTCLRTGTDIDGRMNAPTWRVRIDKSFDSWQVERVQ